MSSTTIFPTGIPSGTFIRAPNYVNLMLLGASSANNVVVPAGCQMVELKASGDVFAKWGSTAVSTAVSTDGSGSELIPFYSGGVRRNIASSLGTTAISVMSTAATNLSVAWWSV